MCPSCVKKEKKGNFVLVLSLRVIPVRGFVVVGSTDGKENKVTASMDLRPVPKGEECMQFWSFSICTMLLGCGRLGT